MLSSSVIFSTQGKRYWFAISAVFLVNSSSALCAFSRLFFNTNGFFFRLQFLPFLQVLEINSATFIHFFGKVTVRPSLRLSIVNASFAAHFPGRNGFSRSLFRTTFQLRTILVSPCLFRPILTSSFLSHRVPVQWKYLLLLLPFLALFSKVNNLLLVFATVFSWMMVPCATVLNFFEPLRNVCVSLSSRLLLDWSLYDLLAVVVFKDLRHQIWTL